MFNKVLCCTLLILASACGYAQDESWKIFDDSQVSRVDISIHPDTLAWIYEHVESDIEHVAFFRFRNSHTDQSFDSIGFRLRGNTSRVSAKKSFKVSLNTFHKGRHFLGIEKINLNGEHNDPSIIRSKLCFDRFGDINLPASRASHARVYINGNYYGLYVNVEHVDEEFLEKNFADPSGNLWKCLYPADLTYLGSDPQLYKDLYSGNRPVYELKTNEKAADFSQFARLIRIINLTPAAALPDSLEKIADIGNILEYFAMDVLLGSWDDYRALMNNYYLYHTPSDGRFRIIPYDYDNTFGVDWFGTDWAQADPYDWPRAVPGNRPLSDRMLQNSQYHDLYTHFLDFYSRKVFRMNLWEGHLTALKTLITPAAEDDYYRTLDYGFTMDDFHNSYTSGSYTNQHVKNGIRQYVNLRNASLGSQLNPLNAPPVVYAMDHSPRYPLAEDSVHLNASCFGSAGIQQVKVLYFIGNSSDIQEVEMVFRPDTLQPQVRKHDRWTATLPPAGAGVRIWYRIEVTDSLLQKKQYPRNGWMPIQSVVNATGDLHINELMASNSVTIADPSGEYDDWVELYNPSSDPVLLTGCYLSDKADNPLKWRIEKETIIAPGGYLLIWCDEDALQPGLHASFKLSAAGESVLLTAADGLTLIDSVHFGSQATDVSFGRYPDATGPWQKMPPTPDASNRALSVPESPDAISGLYIFPNPADDRSSLVFPGSLSQSAILSVLNLSGRPVMPDTEISAGCDRYTLSCSGLNPGLYFLRIQTNDQTRVLKLIKR